jgi:hypothetical protein
LAHPQSHQIFHPGGFGFPELSHTRHTDRFLFPQNSVGNVNIWCRSPQSHNMFHARDINLPR